MSKRDHLRISWDYDSVFSRWIYEKTINNNLLNKNNLVIALYDNNKKIKTFFGVDIYPLRTHPDNEVKLNFLYTPIESMYFYTGVDRSKMEREYDTVKKYLRIYGRSDYYDRVSVETISEDILHFKFLKSPSENWRRDEQASRVVRSSIYILNFSQFKNGYISFYLNSINENSHLFSKNFDELKSLPYINFLNVSTIQKVSSDPEDCEYVWSTDSNCITQTGSVRGYQREIVRITEASANGGVPCNVGTYGVTRYVECSNQDTQPAPSSSPAPAPAPAPSSSALANRFGHDAAYDARVYSFEARICRIGCRRYGADYWCASKDDPERNDCDTDIFLQRERERAQGV